MSGARRLRRAKRAAYSARSSANLRGLGSESTLTLVNGRRLAYDGFQGSTDLSIIPLSAIDHIDVVPDGASAIYGSDAVGGVVNVILRRHYEGAETSASLGGATDSGGLARQQYSQILGKDWGSGSAFVSYEHARQNVVYSSARSFSAGVAAPTTLFPEKKSDSVFATVDQDIAPWAHAFFQGLYANRDTFTAASYPNNPGVSTGLDNANAKQFGAVLGIEVELPHDWRVSASGNISRTRDETGGNTLSSGVVNGNSFETWQNDLRSADVDATGKLITLPTGEVRLAIGGGYREEKFTDEFIAPPSPETRAKRDVKYAYGELEIPLVEPSSTRQGLNRLDLSASGRYENYSDFGNKSTPKLGIAYTPLPAFSLRTTWGKSFRAPSLQQEYAAPLGYLVPLADPTSPTGQTLSLITAGANSQLQPETATSWTAGIDFHPQWETRLKASLNYFNIKYDNRIRIPIANAFTAFSDPTVAAFVVRNPSVPLQQSVLANIPNLLNFSGAPYDPATVGAYINGTPQNISHQRADGIDLTADDSWDIAGATLAASLNTTYLNLRDRLLPTTPEAQLSGTIFNPPKWRARGGVTLQNGSWATSVYLNYSGSEIDPTTIPSTHIASWTTADLQLTYRTPKGNFWGGLEPALSVQNLFNKTPPFVPDASTGLIGLHYDSTNASALGRFISLRLRKVW